LGQHSHLLAGFLQTALARVQRLVELPDFLLQPPLAPKERANRVALRPDCPPAVLPHGHLVSPARRTHARPLVASVKNDTDMRGASRPRRVLVRLERRADENGRRRVSWAALFRSRAALWGEQSGRSGT